MFWFTIRYKLPTSHLAFIDAILRVSGKYLHVLKLEQLIVRNNDMTSTIRSDKNAKIN